MLFKMGQNHDPFYGHLSTIRFCDFYINYLTVCIPSRGLFSKADFLGKALLNLVHMLFVLCIDRHIKPEEVLKRARTPTPENPPSPRPHTNIRIPTKIPTVACKLAYAVRKHRTIPPIVSGIRTLRPTNSGPRDQSRYRQLKYFQPHPYPYPAKYPLPSTTARPEQPEHRSRYSTCSERKMLKGKTDGKVRTKRIGIEIVNTDV